MKAVFMVALGLGLGAVCALFGTLGVPGVWLAGCGTGYALRKWDK